ncbi:MAG: DUF4032 domain-containing protein [Verrucomicrobia bacterium]|nr:DUF4032 domain-containing protein [Verrucomicrobiota bacterium]
MNGAGLPSLASDPNAVFRNSALYREFLLEREEILRHKWYLSEQAGHDVGFEKALLDWIVKHRAEWRNLREKEIAKSESRG